MRRIAFKMKLFKGYETEYKKRHSSLWPELQRLLKQTGISDYSIFWDKQTNDLLGILKLEAGCTMDNLPDHPLMQKWWAFMCDIMETNADQSPVSVPLEEVFYME
ncbi:L-rhamnose mutarotase [Niabella drilacis]|uniref:L-rhamnose mutarotase n=1 Tax=Niabella drilacis (strain DSM 25811 / CCM 8410 / CCUG 62505 / LMG 26954 / E90) TaxID=1285928 RepID=A0A1G6IVL8_NIADE|nr:L-rhamnose mutarotase [Niabella drilacis]SDC10460.1 L-rhamnose mutarotase [Niabella drilacis]